MSENVDRGNTGKWRVVVILWLISFCNYADRTILGAVLPKLKTGFHTSDFRLGLISGIFLWIYAFSAVASGYLADRHSRVSTIRWGLLVWSLLFAMVSFTNGLPLFGSLVAMTGVAEASYYPAALALISSYHNSTRTRALSIHQTAVFTGIAAGGYVAARIAEEYSWRTAYLSFGCAGLLLAAGVWPVLSSLGSRSRQGELGISSRRAEGSTEKWRLLRVPSFVQLALLYVGANVVTYALLTWLPTFLHDARGMTLSDASKYGLGSWNLATLAAVMAGGVLGDRIVGRLGTGARRVLLAASLAFFGGSASLLNSSSNLATTVLCLLLAGSFKGLFDANIYAAVHDVVRPGDRATAVGVLTAFGFTGAAASSVIVGAAARSVGLGTGLSMAGLICCIGAGSLVGISWRKETENRIDIGSFT